MIDLDYDATLSQRTIDHLQEAARAIGLPLRQLELIGQDPDVAAAFIDSVREGKQEAFLATVAWGDLEEKLYGARSPVTGASGSGIHPASA